MSNDPRKEKVAENAAPGTAIYKVPGGRSGPANYALTGADAALFDISASGILTLKAPADFETQESYSVTVVTTRDGKTTSESLLVSVVNLNDTPPQFTSGPTGHVDENAAPGTVIYTAAAVDPDHFKGDMRYSLGGADAGLLRIDAVTGAVTLLASADYEAKASYRFDVIASEGASATAQAVVVMVGNLDDNAPVFTSGATGTVAENAPVDTPIYSATTTDPDQLGAPTYSLGGADAALLDISAAGVVTLKTPADFEAKASYSFDVIASDGAHVTTQALVVDVTNVAPAVGSVAITSASGASNGMLNAGDVVEVTVTMTEPTTVTGTPHLALNIGGETAQAAYVSGSGTSSLVFAYTIAAGQTDANGIGIDADSLVLEGATLADGTAPADLAHAAVPDNAAYMVDTTAPTLSISSSADTLATGGTATITFTFSEDPGASFTDADIAVTGGTLGPLGGSGLTRTATFTATASATLSTGAHISVLPSSFTDAAGNAGDEGSGAPQVDIATVFNHVLFVGNSATFARVDPVMSYNTYDPVTNPDGVHDLTSPERGGSFANLTGSNLYEPHPWGGVPGLVDRFAKEVGLNYDVSISARNAATLQGHYTNSSPAGWDLRGNIASKDWDIVVLQDQTDEPLPGGSGSITFAPGSSTASLIVTPTGDAVQEYDETLALTLAAAGGYRVGTSGAITTTLLNDDPTAPVSNPALPTVTLVANPGSVAEDGTGNLVYTFTRTGATTSDLVINFTVFRDGSTSPSVSTTISSSQDLEMYNTTTGAFSATGGSSTSPYRFTNGGGFATSGSTGVNTTTGSVSFTSNTGTIVIKAGQTSASLTMDPHADTAIESDESIKVTLVHPSAGADYNIGTAGPVTATIVNDDFAAGVDTSLPNVTLALSSAASTYENAGQQLVYTFTRSGSTANALTVNFNESGTATYFASDPSKSDFGITTTGATGATLVTTSGANADIPGFEKYATLIENYIHTGAADSITVPGTTIPANVNADLATDVYLYATWARPDMIAGAWDEVTDKTLVTSGPNAGAYTGTGSITQSSTQATAYFLTLEGMSSALTYAYTHLAAVNPDFAGVAPVSTAFMTAVQNGLAVRDPYTEASTSSVATGKVDLWFDDNLHASKYGSYLAGLTLFETLTGLDARALGAGDQVAADLGIDAATAVALQGVASATLGFDPSHHWSAPGAVDDLGGSNASATLATAGAFTFVDASYTAHSVTVQSQAGNLGTLTASVRSDGHAGQVNWLYTVDNAVADPLLAPGAQREDRFTVLLDDGHGHVSAQIIGIDLHGTPET
ncbi:cadherin domain-containing protein [Caenimonas aquaedulcis]|uniref:Cadherin repeat domain-containing protein n=1 Tax=Caenimonas aquaedulcis TaxID=2793270 RepID=A0A931MHW5_9BURK|nr:cadherin domain-containing protein [Caenimonas aquaedulcis]MBG9388595.1 cadherin repeat domain-containing protein [Caenimonas aquaedulcis]